MTRMISKGSASVIAVFGVSALVAFELAASAPSSDPLYYRGELRAADGLPIMGAHVIGVELWDRAQDGERVCTVSPQAIEVNRGRFDLALSDDCADAFGRGRAAWADLMVDGERVSPRAQLTSPRVQPKRPTAAPGIATPDALPAPTVEPAREPHQVTAPPAIDVAGEPREAILCI